MWEWVGGSYECDGGKRSGTESRRKTGFRGGSGGARRLRRGRGGSSGGCWRTSGRSTSSGRATRRRAYRQSDGRGDAHPPGQNGAGGRPQPQHRHRPGRAHRGQPLAPLAHGRHRARRRRGLDRPGTRRAAHAAAGPLPDRSRGEARAAGGDLPLLARPHAGRHGGRARPAGRARGRPGQGLLAQPDRPRPGPHPPRRGRLAAPGRRRPAPPGGDGAPRAGPPAARTPGILRRAPSSPCRRPRSSCFAMRTWRRSWPRSAPTPPAGWSCGRSPPTAATWPRNRRAPSGKLSRPPGSSSCSCRSSPTPAASRRAASTSTCCPSWKPTWPPAASPCRRRRSFSNSSG